VHPKLKDLKAWIESAEPDARVFAAGYLVLLPLYLAPLLVTPFLPGLDLPFHLSMADMLSKAGHPDSPYARFYDGVPMLAPYAAHYLALWLLGKVVMLTTAHKIIIALYVAGLPLAASSLLGVCERSRIPALLAFPLAYNLTLHYGFVSSALSLPVVMLLLAQMTRFLLWEPLRFRPGRRRLYWHWAGAAGAAVLLFLCHLQNFLYGVAAALAFVLFCRASWQRRLLGAAALLPSVAALLWWKGHSLPGDPVQDKRNTVSYVWSTLKAARLADMGGVRRLGIDVLDRLYDLPGHALRSFTDGVDVRACRTLMMLILLYGCLGLLARAFERSRLAERPARMVVACWVAFGGAVFAYLALPHHLPAFDLMTFFPRFAPLAVAMMLPLVPAELKRFGGGLRWLLLFPALLMCGLYGRELVRHYDLYGDELADYVAVLAKAEPGHKAVSLVFDRRSRVMRTESPFVGQGDLYAVAKPAPASMTPLWYCGMRHIPCRARPDLAKLPAPPPWEPNKFDPDRAVPFFDYFFARSPPASGATLFGRYQSAVELVAHQGTWWLWRRKPGAKLPAPLAPPPPETWPAYDD
jgi:hypothetical protein